MRWSQGISRIAGAGVLAAALAACGSSKSTGPTTQAITQANAAVVASYAQEGVDVALSGLTNAATDLNPATLAAGGGGLLFDRYVSPQGPSHVGSLQHAALGSLIVHTRTSDCPTITPGASDTVYTFEASSCTYTGSGDTVTASGTITLQDEVNTSSSFGYAATFGNFTLSESGNGVDFTIVENGSRTLTGTSTTLSLVDNWTFNFNLQEDTVAETFLLDDNLSLAYTSGGATIDFTSGTLPAGSFTISGSLDLQAQVDGYTGSYALTFVTVSALQYDPSCTNFNNPNHLVGGTLKVAGSSSPGAAAVEMTFNACGTATTTQFIAAS